MIREGRIDPENIEAKLIADENSLEDGIPIPLGVVQLYKTRKCPECDDTAKFQYLRTKHDNGNILYDVYSCMKCGYEIKIKEH